MSPGLSAMVTKYDNFQSPVISVGSAGFEIGFTVSNTIHVTHYKYTFLGSECFWTLET